MQVEIELDCCKYDLRDSQLDRVDNIRELRAYFRQEKLLQAWGRAPKRLVVHRRGHYCDYYYEDGVPFLHSAYVTTGAFSVTQLRTVSCFAAALTSIETRFDLRTMFGADHRRLGDEDRSAIAVSCQFAHRAEPGGFMYVELLIHDDRIELMNGPTYGLDEIEAIVAALPQYILADNIYRSWFGERTITPPLRLWQLSHQHSEAGLCGELLDLCETLQQYSAQQNIDQNLSLAEQLRQLMTKRE